jgi:hypothetical protein
METVVIIGAGIAGLYTGYQLLKKNKYKIIIIEKEKELGGRLYTNKVNINNEIYYLEGGAGVLRDDDNYLINILKELRIPIKLWNSNTDIIYNNGERNENLEYDYKKDIVNLCKKSDNFTTFISLLENDFEMSFKEKIGILIGTTYSELFYANSKNVCENNDFYEFLYYDHHKFGKPESWNYLSDSLASKINEMGGIIINKTTVSEIRDNFIKTNKNDIIKFNKLVITCPYHYFQKILVNSSFDSWKLLMTKYHEEVDYLRIYSYFKEPINLKNKIATNLAIRRVIPLSDRMIMTVYTDGKDAKNINKICKNNKLLNIYIRKELGTLLEKDIPEIEKNWCFFWKKGISFWKPSHYPVSDIIKISRNPLKNIYFCGDSYSVFPGWIESALESCQYIIKEF